MTMPASLKDYLSARGTRYELVSHPRSPSSQRTAESAHVPGDQLAKSVVLRDEEGAYLIAVLPATCQVQLGVLSRVLSRRVGLVSEDELAGLFRDCQMGAVPPVGAAYGLETLVDERLLEQPHVYFEAGDHEHLVRVSVEQFCDILQDFRRADFSSHG